MNKHHKVNRKMKGSKRAFIFGPFIGDLYWEAFRFAPYAISLKKRFPKHHLIVFTRPRSFDLYGQYANVFVPLKIKDGMYKEQGYKLKAYPVSEYKGLCSYIKQAYSNLYEISDHYAPQIDGFMYKVKWQYPRDYMDYDFKPRKENLEIIKEMYELKNVIITDKNYDYLNSYNAINKEDFFNEIQNSTGQNSSPLGCLIELLKKCKFVVSNFDDNLARFSLLCGTPVITIKEKKIDDAIRLMNPKKEIVIKCENIEEGIDQYETYFRSEKSGSRK